MVRNRDLDCAVFQRISRIFLQKPLLHEYVPKQPSLFKFFREKLA
jgi:hypothetical protein